MGILIKQHLQQYFGGGSRSLEGYLALQTLQNSYGSDGMWMVIS